MTSVLSIVKFAINRWGNGKLRVKRNKKIYEQTNLQLNIEKSKKILKWKPKFSIKERVNITIDWYRKVLKKQKTPEQITENQIKAYMRY